MDCLPHILHSRGLSDISHSDGGFASVKLSQSKYSKVDRQKKIAGGCLDLLKIYCVLSALSQGDEENLCATYT